jgi:hypothetical protein
VVLYLDIPVLLQHRWEDKYGLVVCLFGCFYCFQTIFQNLHCRLLFSQKSSHVVFTFVSRTIQVLVSLKSPSFFGLNSLSKHCERVSRTRQCHIECRVCKPITIETVSSLFFCVVLSWVSYCLCFRFARTRIP